MDEKLLKTLIDTFRTLIPQSFYKFNYEEVVIYPYLTFDFTKDADNTVYSNRKYYYIDCDIFDNNGINSLPLINATFELEEFVQSNITNCVETDNHFIRFLSITTRTIPTESDVINRKNAQIYISVDERTKKYD